MEIELLNKQDEEVVSYFVRQKKGLLDTYLDKKYLNDHLNSPRSFIRRMKEDGVLRSIQWGRYIVTSKENPQKNPLYHSFEVLPKLLLERLGMEYYVSWHSALWYYGLLDQQSGTITAAITGRKVNYESETIGVRFVSLSKGKFFGYTERSISGHRINMAVPEKALIDSFAHPDLSAPYSVIVNSLREAAQDKLISGNKFAKMCLRMESPALNRRIGFWMERYEIDGYQELLPHLGHKYAVSLAPGPYEKTETATKVNRKWKVLEDIQIIYTVEHMK